ncbi:formin-like protein 3 [Iris pallida]|uniref:Formin-like protein 3 n=1 Tax=Iris pallida TaxID=29817 RepID=A0AAX6EM71_IRIPA|nr:formin-like protein 3 [Iris pallida]
MNMRKNLLLITILMMLVSARLPRVSRGRPVAADSKLILSPEAMVEQILLNCGLNPTEMQTVVRSLDLSILHGILTDSAKTKLNRKFMNEVMHKKGETTLPNCQSKHIFLHVSGEDSHKNWYSEYFTSLYGRDTLSRRHLADQTSSGVLHAFDPSLAPVLVSLSSLDHNVESPSYSPPTSRSALASPSPLATFRYEFLQKSDSTMDYKLLPPEEHKNSESSPVVTVVIVVLTAAATSVITILFFFCCKRCLGNKYKGDRLKDESPLLTLNTRNFSGSSQESNGLVGAIQKDKIGHIVNLDGSGEAPASGTPSGNLASSTNASTNDISLMRLPLPPLKPPPGRKVAFTPSLPPPAPPPPIAKPKPGSPPPAPSKAAPPPPKVAPPHPSRVRRPSLLGPDHSDDTSTDAHAPKTKLKPLFWDKVSTNPENSMVWNEIKAGSFQFNEEMIESLFGYCYDDKGKNEHKKALSSKDPSQYIILLEPKKSQNLAISLKAMGVKVDDVSGALMEGNELPVELLQTLLRMEPNNDEELRIRSYTGDLSLLGPGEQFLKAILEIRCAFKRLDALLFMTSLEEDVSSIKESFACLEASS